MADISQLKVNGTIYDIKDAVARLAVTNTLHFKGVTTTAVTNGGTLVPADIYKHSDGTTPTVADIAVGDMIIYGKGEYIWAMSDGTGNTSATGHWILIDALNAYGSLASKNSVSVEVKNSGAHTHLYTYYTYAGDTTDASLGYTPSGSILLTLAANVAKQTANVSGGGKYPLSTTSLKGVAGTVNVLSSVKSAGSFGTINTPTEAVVTGIKASGANASANVTGEILELKTGNLSYAVSATTNAVTGVSFTNQSMPTFNTTTVATANSTATTVATGKFYTGKIGSTTYKEVGSAALTALPTVSTDLQTVNFTSTSAKFEGSTAYATGTITPKLKQTSATGTITSSGAHAHEKVNVAVTYA